MKQIDKLFREKLAHHEIDVPDTMWDQIVPTLEEKTGRTVLWFWLAGLGTILLLGLAYLLSSGTNKHTEPLAVNSVHQEVINVSPSVEKIVNSTKTVKSIETPIVTDKKIIKKKVAIKSKAVSHKTAKNQAAIIHTPLATNLSKVVNEKKIDMKGKPANLVITKSYISDNGAIIEKSNVGKDDSNTPSYNVFINSEGIGAGALMRIVEPLQNIPLPSFVKGVKKKNILTIF